MVSQKRNGYDTTEAGIIVIPSSSNGVASLVQNCRDKKSNQVIWKVGQRKGHTRYLHGKKTHVQLTNDRSTYTLRLSSIDYPSHTTGTNTMSSLFS